MNTSVTQIEAMDRCPRLFLLQYVMKLPVFKKPESFGYGNILHACCERYLKGQDPFPPGWDTDKETSTVLNPQQRAEMMSLIAEAVREGHLERRPDGQVESWYSLACGSAQIRGKIDYSTKDRVEDHKNAKDVRYLKSPKALRKDIQMMTYAYSKVQEALARGEVPPPVITLVHNQFVKAKIDAATGEVIVPASVRQTVAEVTLQEVEEFFSGKTRPLVGKMQEVAKIQDPWSLPEPPPSACSKYGGCSFLTLCTGSETIPAYKTRIENMVTESMKAFLAKRQAEKAQDTPAAAPQAAINPPAPAAKPAVTPTLASLAPAVPAAAASQGPPPWFSKNCRRCASEANPGFNSAKGTACSSCVILSKVPTTGYHWAVQPNGKIAWASKSEPLPAQGTTVVDAGKRTAAPSIPETLAKTPETPPLSFEELCTVIGDSTKSQLEALSKELVSEAYAHLDPEDVETLLGFIDDAASEAQPEAAVAAPPAAPAPEPEPAPAAADKPPRGQRRVRKETPAAAPVQGTLPLGEPAAKASGFILMLGANVVRGSLPGFEVAYVEDILGSVDGYWQDEVFARRDKIWKAISKDPKPFVEALQGKIVVQQAKTPDNDNMISALMSLGPTIIASTMV